MNTSSIRNFKPLVACTLLCSLAAPLRAWEPNVKDMDAAISSGEFSGYFTNLTTWLGQKTPADPAKLTHPALTRLLEDPGIAPVLAQRQFLAKVGPAPLGAFAMADAANKPFLTWILKNRQVMELFLEGATPVRIAARDDNSWSISPGTLEIWKKIYLADPDSRQGIYLRLAMATALRPPGTGSPGSGQQKTPSDPVVRYKYFKTAHANKELFPSFDKLTVWDYQFVVNSGASEADLSWGREMINTWNPTFKNDEKVVDTTSCMWRRNSPVPHVDYRAVLDGGGKCGPRSSWSVFICQAWGIPAIGVGQPAHACVAYKAMDGHWQVAYGRGWNASKLEGMSGGEFVEGTEARLLTTAFNRVEHMRWLAAALPAREQSTAVLAVGKSITQALAVTKRDLAASEKAGEMDADSGAVVTVKNQGAANPTLKPEPPYKPVPGVIHVEGPGYFETGGITVWGGEPRVTVLDSTTGGKQLFFPQGMASCWVGYKIDVPQTGIYELTAKVATINGGQAFSVRSFGAMAPVKCATASNTYRGQVKDLGPQFAIDNNPSTRWACSLGVDNAMLELDLSRPTTISTVMIDERAYSRVSKFVIEYKNGQDWKPIIEGTVLGSDYVKDFPPVTAQHVRLHTLDCSGTTGGPTIWEFSVGSIQDGHAWMELPWTAGLWQVTKPVDIRLVKGSQTIWFNAPYQRGVSFKYFDLKPKTK